MRIDRGKLMEQIAKALERNGGGLILSHEWRCTVAGFIADDLIEQFGDGLFATASAVAVTKQAVELRAAIEHHGGGSITDTPTVFFDQLWRAVTEAQKHVRVDAPS